MVFNYYAQYYDLLYKDKDYLKESEYIDNLIKTYAPTEGIKILDIGCGTGIHANYLAQKGYQIVGIDRSEEMIKQAQLRCLKNCEFIVSDATNFSLKEKFDSIISLFHVVSYQTSNKDLNDLFTNVSLHLKNDGLFIFDFWYGPAVLTEKPSVRIKRLENDQINITRIAEPIMRINSSVVDVNYELIIQDKKSLTTEIIKEIHQMRYLLIPEINYYLKSCGLITVHFEEWLTGKEPGCNTWSICCIAKRVDR